MIITVTFNPALDYAMKIGDFKSGITNRSFGEEITFGGKGINVSYVLSQLKISNIALGFVGGFTGEALISELESNNIKTDFVKLKKGFTRINVKLKGDIESEINAEGPEILEEELNQLFEKLHSLNNGDYLVLAGSIPKSLDNDLYEKIMFNLKEKDIRFVIDATGDLLVNTLKYRPFLIKPNKQELEEIFKVSIKNEEKIIEYAQRLKRMGAENVLVSLGADGAILVDQTGKVHKATAKKITTVNTVGAGDSMVAGFLAGCDKGYSYALKLGIAAGTATAASKNLAKEEEILEILNS